WGGRSFTFDPGTLHQVLYLGVLPQLTFWVAYTVIAGLAGAALAAAWAWARRRPRMGLMATGAPAAAGREG
ncbi:MAG TPA: hypothetical protein VMR21_03985, partial [Vicinamibacteria bacterium]|nr:hypothetical protein [Vicinamibacteria bacterium]